MARTAALLAVLLVAAGASCQVEAFLMPPPPDAAVGGGRVITGGGGARAGPTKTARLSARPVSSLAPSSFLPTAAGRSLVFPSQRSTTALWAEPFSTEKEYDQFLAELIFSQNDITDDVLRNLDRACDEDFLAWLIKKANDSEDLDERVGLKNLHGTISSIIDKVKQQADLAPPDEALATDEDEVVAPFDRSGVDGTIQDAQVSPVVGSAGAEDTSDERVFAEMARVQRRGLEATEDKASSARGKMASPFETVPANVRASYDAMLNAVLERDANVSLESAVEAVYEKVDVQFLTLMNQRINEDGGKAEGADKLQAIVTEINNIMERRMSEATERLGSILAEKEPQKMVAKIGLMAQKGEVNDALVLLLDGNIQQAETAGAEGAVKIMKMLKERVEQELDGKADEDKKLLRRLLRTEDSVARVQILEEAFRPRAKLALSEDEESSEEPLVTPPKFIQTVKNLILNFGNIEKAEPQFGAKLDMIIREAEQTATELFGESESIQQRQDRAWDEQGVSVFDLERAEEQAMCSGEEAPWANDKYDTMMPDNLKGRVLDGSDWNVGGLQ